MYIFFDATFPVHLQDFTFRKFMDFQWSFLQSIEDIMASIMVLQILCTFYTYAL